MKRKISLLIASATIINLAGCTFFSNKSAEQSKIADKQSESVNEQSKIDEDGKYYSVEDVALYIHTYGKLPQNYITINKARELGWESGSDLEEYAEGCVIGGGVFRNREGLLPEAEGRVYRECNIRNDENKEESATSTRIVYSNDGLIYVTRDRFESFELLYGEE